MATAAKKGPSKPIFKTARPYTDTQWPVLSSAQRTDVIDLLCSILQPLGDHRRTHIHSSKGKKRKRELKKTEQDPSKKDLPEDSDTRPSAPEIGNHILIGLNSVTRHLEQLVAQTAPPTAPTHEKEKTSTRDKPVDSQSLRPLAIVLIPHNHPPASLPHAHVPTLVHLATLKSPKETATRLLAVPPGCETPIAEALHIPHVGALGILGGAPGADALIAYVREHVEVTRCAWIDEAMAPEWKGVKIDMAKG